MAKFEEQFKSLAQLAAAVADPEVGVGSVLNTCGVTTLGERAVLKNALQQLLVAIPETTNIETMDGGAGAMDASQHIHPAVEHKVKQATHAAAESIEHAAHTHAGSMLMPGNTTGQRQRLLLL